MDNISFFPEFEKEYIRLSPEDATRQEFDWQTSSEVFGLIGADCWGIAINKRVLYSGAMGFGEHKRIEIARNLEPFIESLKTGDMVDILMFQEEGWKICATKLPDNEWNFEYFLLKESASLDTKIC